MPPFANPLDFEQAVITQFEQAGWLVKPVSPAIKDYTFEIVKGNERIAVQLRNHKAKVHIGYLEKFIDFLEQPAGACFTKGFLISTSGFSPSVFTYMRTEEVIDISLGTFTEGQVFWEIEEPPPLPREQLTYIGVFTCKGGVGKTTVSAHLAGAFALNGYDVILIDLDRQSNLRKLLGDGVYLPGPKGSLGATITVLNHDEWREEDYPEVKVVICDCSPEYDANPEEFIKRFNYCIIPTTLNPLGINKNADVIKRTFKAVRRVNGQADLYVLINNYHSEEDKRNVVLNDILRSEIDELTVDDSRCHYINPEIVAIRFSKQLLYWGYHLVEGSKPQLAFREIAGRSFPKADFLKLLDYLEGHTAIEMAKEHE